jgi:hypothetical protein
MSRIERRRFMKSGGAALAIGAVPLLRKPPLDAAQTARFRFGLNTATLRGYQLGLAEHWSFYIIPRVPTSSVLGMCS